jgi:hypothetical protein
VRPGKIIVRATAFLRLREFRKRVKHGYAFVSKCSQTSSIWLASTARKCCESSEFSTAVKKARLAGAKLRGVFAAGLGGLGLLGWRTKRKNAAAIAAARNFQIAGRF